MKHCDAAQQLARQHLDALEMAKTRTFSEAVQSISKLPADSYFPGGSVVLTGQNSVDFYPIEVSERTQTQGTKVVHGSE